MDQVMQPQQTTSAQEDLKNTLYYGVRCYSILLLSQYSHVY